MHLNRIIHNVLKNSKITLTFLMDNVWKKKLCLLNWFTMTTQPNYKNTLSLDLMKLPPLSNLSLKFKTPRNSFSFHLLQHAFPLDQI